MDRLQRELYDRVYQDVRIGAHVPLHPMTIKYFPDSQMTFHQDSAFRNGLIWMSQYAENPFCTKNWSQFPYLSGCQYVWSYSRESCRYLFALFLLLELISHSTTLPQATSSTTPSTTTYPSSQKKTNTGVIAGGVVSGVVGLALIACIVFWLLRRRQTSTMDTRPTGTSFVFTRTPKLYVRFCIT